MEKWQSENGEMAKREGMRRWKGARVVGEQRVRKEPQARRGRAENEKGATS